MLEIKNEGSWRKKFGDVVGELSLSCTIAWLLTCVVFLCLWSCLPCAKLCLVSWGVQRQTTQLVGTILSPHKEIKCEGKVQKNTKPHTETMHLQQHEAGLLRRSVIFLVQFFRWTLSSPAARRPSLSECAATALTWPGGPGVEAGRWSRGRSGSARQCLVVSRADSQVTPNHRTGSASWIRNYLDVWSEILANSNSRSSPTFISLRITGTCWKKYAITSAFFLLKSFGAFRLWKKSKTQNSLSS